MHVKLTLLTKNFQVNLQGIAYAKKCLGERDEGARICVGDVETILGYSSSRLLDILKSMPMSKDGSVKLSVHERTLASSLYLEMCNAFLVHGMMNMMWSTSAKAHHALVSRIAPLDRYGDQQQQPCFAIVRVCVRVICAGGC